MASQTWRRCRPETVDLGGAGTQRLEVRLDTLWAGRPGVVDLPMAVFGRGDGPTVLLTGGTHGDELEGQAVAWHLIRTLSDDAVTGRLLVLPSHNRPACLAGTRASPIDGVDLNRVFPGGETPGPTHAIARFVAGHLMPACDAYLDLHSGGSAYRFVLSANLQGRPGTPEVERDLPALLAMDAPYAIVFDQDETDTMPHRGTAEAHFRGLGRPALSSEYGGGPMSSLSFRTALHGTTSLLRHFGVLAGDAVAPARSRSRLLRLRGGAQYVGAPVAGLLVPRADLGQAVRAGTLLGEVFPDDPRGTVRALRAAADGIVIAIATGCPADGEPAFMIAEPLTP